MDSPKKIRMFFKDKNILITGGAGMLGSNLAYKLVSMGSRVTILDALLPLYGGDRFNIAGIRKPNRFVKGNILDRKLIERLVKGKDIIFSLAAQADYLKSNEMPLEDLDINTKAQLILLNACLMHNKRAKILFPSSRLVYGKIKEIPVSEGHVAKPLSHYALHKFLSEEYFKLYNRLHDMDTVVFRISNPFGPRQQMKHCHYSIVGWFTRLAMENKTIKIFGDGRQIRDYIFIDDLVEAFLYAASSSKVGGKVLNVGSGVGTRFIDMAKAIVGVVGSGRIRHVRWPKGYEKNETGDYIADISQIKRLGWRPKISFEDGVRMTCDYYKEYAKHYF